MKQFNSEIILNEKIAEGFYILKFIWPKDLAAPEPGQFLTVRASSGTDPLLRRPFAISGFANNTAEIIYQNRGKSTSLLTEKQKGDSIDIIAPLGNSFIIDKNKKHLLVAGGIGLGPILFFHKSLLNQGIESTMVAGFRNSTFIPEELKSLDNTILCKKN